MGIRTFRNDRGRRWPRLILTGLVLGAAAAVGAGLWLITPPPPYTPLTGVDKSRVALFALGDQGSGDMQQWRVALGMEHAAERNGGVGMVVLLGDNFYGPALKGTADHAWELKFERVYWGSWLSHVPFYAVLGNHDYPSSSEVELAYSREARGSGRWQMPGRVYSRDFGDAGGRPVLRVVFLDTSQGREGILEQAAFIREAFAAGPVPIWRVVAAHHPLRNRGKHGDDEELLGDLLPVLEQSGVDLYLAGHDHNQQLILRPGEPAWVISGGGGQNIYPLGEVNREDTPFALSRPGFTGLEFTPGQLRLAYYDENGGAERRFSWGRGCAWGAQGCLLAEPQGKLAGN
ncbi:metallophosphoesterase [Pseudomonas citronellolis]|uniref:metallophosphoesterase n=1 Tax=Pseudomonas citronellolis TaxID=53408 RepID=UPI0023E45FEB|nr:metallophosphoesterase [Pseudomonas citronellolis]MDF3936998.1 metallophosphoesterase [Pseudomonas citronellolis]